MNVRFFRQCLALLLAVSILFSQFPALTQAAGEPSPTDATALSEPVPSEEPVESVPEESIPDESVPVESVPEESIPEESVPEESVPKESVPEESIPEESVPEESAPEEPIPKELVPEVLLTEEAAVSGPGLYFGLLHAHSGLSDGVGTPAEAFAHAAQVEGLDFFALTDHSHSFDNHELGQIYTDACAISQDWADGKAAAAAVTSATFVGLFGYEMSWPSSYKIGHISTFFTPGFQSWKQDAYNNYDGGLSNYYETLAAVPGSVSQFNHPGSQYGTFSDFDYSEKADAVISLLEVGSGKTQAYDDYIRALDLGWHLAPTNNQANHDSSWGSASSVRTAVYAQALTEDGLAEALGQCRAYATEDADLEILYSMEGAFMGSRLDMRDLGETADISVTLRDPTDASVGSVEVVTNEGRVLASDTLAAASGTLTFSLPPEAGYYLLRVTQPDGDTAVTAPIWVDGEEELGIAAFVCETPVPEQNQDFLLTLALYNQESADFLVDSLEIFADNDCIAVCELAQIDAGSSISLPITLNCDRVGLTRIRASLTGTLEGSSRTYEADLVLSFHQSRQITSILVDGSHGNTGLDRLTILRQLAREESIRLTISQEEATEEILKNNRFFLISAPSEPFSDAFVESVAAYARYGGSLVLCGQGDSQDKTVHSAAELNRLLAAAGATMRIRDDLALDTVNNGGDSHRLYLETINRDLDWCSNVSENQVFQALFGATVDPGSGSWMIKGFSTTACSDGDGDGLGGDVPGNAILMACESLSGGGTVFASGSLFLADESMAESKNIWDEPYANRTIAQALLGIGGDAIPLSTIQQARAGDKNELFRVRGYVTAGNSNPHNTFPNTLYLQDDTGGIAVTPFSGGTIQTGTPVEITGFANSQKGNRELKRSSWKVLDADNYQYEPLEGDWRRLLDPDQNGGALVQVEGKCREIYCRDDDTMSGCLLEDDSGRRVQILIEDYIGNGSDGENELHKSIRKGRTVRAMGLLYVDEYGDAVIRVRNCEEVVYVPPRILPGQNALTGDRLIAVPLLATFGSLAGLLLLLKKRKYQ
ncbi:MAG: CehA/McbA family metallohydrolase [Faecousia sp.]